MNEDFYDFIRNLIKRKALINIDSNHQTLTLQESEENSKLSSVIIHNIKEPIVAFKLDFKPGRSNCLCNLFQGKKGENKGCDAVVFYQDYILLIELKSCKTRDAETQLKSSNAFVDYIFAVITHLSDIKDINTMNFKRINIIFTTKTKKYHPANKNPINNRERLKPLKIIYCDSQQHRCYLQELIS